MAVKKTICNVEKVFVIEGKEEVKNNFFLDFFFFRKKIPENGSNPEPEMKKISHPESIIFTFFLPGLIIHRRVQLIIGSIGCVEITHT